MIAFLFVGQLLAADSTYASPALRALVADAAAAAAAPPDLAGYSATLETDLALLQPDEQGREHAVQLEQIESRLTWDRTGALEQHVTGYRARGGPTLSALSLLRRPWVLPTLYGDRLRLLLGSRAIEGRASGPGDTLAVHPLAADRDAVYRFTGGDTVLVMRSGDRRVTLVRLHVVPRADLHTRLLVFRGDVDVDAERKQIVHLRGELLTVARPSLAGRARRAVLRRHVLVEIQDAEFRGRYWLPAYERIDVQARSALSEGFRPGFRMITRFHDLAVDSAAADGVALAAHDDPRGRLTFAPHDSLDAFRGWRAEIGANATDVSASDFDDVVATSPTPDRRPVVAWRAERLSDVLRYDKIEGLYTAASGALALGARDTASALTLGGHLGWAWADGTARGAVALRARRGAWRTALSAGRELENTSDFLPPLEGPATVSALLVSIDDYDYVDQSRATLSGARAFGAGAARVLRVEVGPGRDAAVRNGVTRGIILLDSTFRPNRPVTSGSYLREAVSLAVNPGVSGDFLEPGVGYTLAYERGDGGLRWQRVDARLAARHSVGRVTYAGRVMGAAVFGGSPYQQLIEFGENEGMPGFGYKAFGGDRAVLGRAAASYRFQWLQAPLRLHRWITIPGPAPAVTVALHGGWAAATSAATRSAFAGLGYMTGPDGTRVLRTRPTDGVRSSIAIAVDAFDGAIGLGVAHPLDRGGWRIVLGSQAW